jgi:hypothetical protein
MHTASLTQWHRVSHTQHTPIILAEHALPFSHTGKYYLPHTTHTLSLTQETHIDSLTEHITHRLSYTQTRRVSHTKHTQILSTEHALYFSITYSEILSYLHNTHSVSHTRHTPTPMTEHRTPRLSYTTCNADWGFKRNFLLFWKYFYTTKQLHWLKINPVTEADHTSLFCCCRRISAPHAPSPVCYLNQNTLRT